jgi:ketosteroid isomerase-like protein
MSQENVEVVRRCYGFWTNRDLSLLTELVDPDAVLDLSRNVFNPGLHHGFEDLMRFLEQVDETWESFQIEPEELIDGGDHVFAAVRMSGRGRRSGVEVEMELFAVWTLRDGKVVRLTGGYRDRSESLEAAGLRE